MNPPPFLPPSQKATSTRNGSISPPRGLSLGWRLGLTTAFIVTVFCILLCLLVAEYFLVARPLRHLLEGIRQMEMGYWGGLKIPKGAREIRWLAYRFQRLGGELEETMRRLVDAERRALIDLSGKPNPPPRMATSETEEDDTLSARVPKSQEENPAIDRLKLEENLLPQYLSDKCRLLESGDPFDPAMQASAEEAWERDVILAERLGALHLKSRLEDASLRILKPERFNALQHSLATLVASRKEWFREQEVEIRETLENKGLPFREIQHRIKHVGSIWRKIYAKGLKVEQLHDIFAFRIIVAEERDCYRVLEAIHHQFDPRLLRFKDYIASPKPSGYRASTPAWEARRVLFLRCRSGRWICTNGPNGVKRPTGATSRIC